jgi:hypothetical protein
MKLVRLYEEILRENQAEACIAKFGKELFDPQLSISGEPSEVEPNTDTENDYLQHIEKFTGIYSGPMMKKEFISAMQNLKGCMKMYPEVLQPEGNAYRGVALPLTELLLQFDDISDDLDKGGEFTMIYKPKSIIQSWTDEEDTAKGFAKASPRLIQWINKYKQVKNDPKQLAAFIQEIYPELKQARCPVVIRLVTNPDDFLFKAKYFAFLSQFEGENELLRVNQKPTKVTATIADFLFDDVYGILRAVKHYENLKSKQG